MKIQTIDLEIDRIEESMNLNSVEWERFEEIKRMDFIIGIHSFCRINIRNRL